MKSKEELNVEQLEKVVGGVSIEAIHKVIDIEPTWAKVPESIKTAIKNAYITAGSKAAHRLAEKLLGKYPDSKKLLKMLPG